MMTSEHAAVAAALTIQQTYLQFEDVIVDRALLSDDAFVTGRRHIGFSSDM